MSERLIPVVTSVSVGQGRCRHCGNRVLWAITASRPGHPSKTLPWNPPRPWPLSTTRNDESGIVVEWWPASSLHFTTCTQKSKTTKRKPVRAMGSSW